jgi:hypothetical protein
MMYFWKLVKGEIAEARRVVEQLRQKAIDLKWLPVGDVVHLTDDDCRDSERLPGKFLLMAAGDTVLAPHEIVFFEATPPGDEPRPFGLALTPATWKAVAKSFRRNWPAGSGSASSVRPISRPSRHSSTGLRNLVLRSRRLSGTKRSRPGWTRRARSGLRRGKTILFEQDQNQIENNFFEEGFADTPYTPPPPPNDCLLSFLVAKIFRPIDGKDRPQG